MEKLHFLQDLFELRGLPSLKTAIFAYQTSPCQTRKDKRRIKTIFDHFWDKPARQSPKSSTLFSTHVMACGRVPERLCYVWIKRYLWVWDDKTLPQSGGGWIKLYSPTHPNGKVKGYDVFSSSAHVRLKQVTQISL
jgi:hypothetical protein